MKFFCVLKDKRRKKTELIILGRDVPVAYAFYKMDKNECIICKRKSGLKEKLPVFSCDTCSTYYCGECAELSASEIKCMQLVKQRILKFICRKCSDNELNKCLINTIKDKENTIEDKINIIKMLQEKIKLLETSSPMTYANIVTSNYQHIAQQPRKNVPAVIIQPINPQNATITKEEIQKKIDPKSINVSINSVKTGNNGNLIIKCNTEEDAKKLIEVTKKQQLVSKYNVKLSQMKKPRIKIITSTENINQDEIEKGLRNQNKFITPEDYFKITFTTKNRSGNTLIFAECSGDLFKKFMVEKKVFVGWERCPVYEDLMIPKCKRCNAYDHKEINCKNKLTCPICNEEHKMNDCPRNVKKCCNCLKSNLKYKHLNYDMNHEANNRECPTFKYYLQRLTNSIDYNSK